MAHSTRSQGSIEELDKKQKQLDEREKQIRTQHQTMQREREELERLRTGGEVIDADSLLKILSQIQNEVSKLNHLPDQVNQLEKRLNETSQVSNPEENQRDLVPEDTPAVLPALKFKDVVANIPAYDGYKISIFQFSRACKRARNLLPSVQEPQLVQFIINKLEGDAYQVVEGIIYTRVEDLLDKLKAIFAPNKSIAQYRGELANAYKLPTETILKYAGKIKDFKSAILDGYRRQGKILTYSFKVEIDQEVLEAFINGLPSNLITRMEHRQITDLDEAIEWAVKLSKNLEVEKMREQRSFHKFNPSLRSDIPKVEPPRQELPKSILKNPNSSIPQPWIKPLIPGQPGPNSPSVCRYCKSPGHEISNCKKLAFRNSTQNSGNAEGRPVTSATRDAAQSTAHPISTEAESLILEG